MVNADAAIFPHSMCMGARDIFVNRYGQVLLAGFDHIKDPELAEVMAMRYTLSSILQGNYSELIAMSDFPI
jgi:hypothetical protein